MIGRLAIGAVFLLLVGCASENYRPVIPELPIRGSSDPFVSRHQDAGAANSNRFTECAAPKLDPGKDVTA